MPDSAATFGAVCATLLTAHQWADHCWQTDAQAARKGRPEPGTANPPSRVGQWRALGAHVVWYHVVMGAMLAVVVVALALPVTPAGCTAGLGFSALTHGFLDRRWPVVKFMQLTNSPNWATTAQGRYLVDQGHHWFCLWLAGLLVVLV